MKEILDFIKIIISKNDYDLEGFSHIIEKLYFSNIRRWFQLIKNSTEIKICKDLVNLDVALTSKTIKGIKIKTMYIKENNAVKKYENRVKLKDHEIAEIIDELIDPNRYYLDAIMISEILLREVRKERFRWFFVILISAVATILGVILKILGDIYVQLVK